MTVVHAATVSVPALSDFSPHECCVGLGAGLCLSPFPLQERRCRPHLINEDTQGTGVQRCASLHRRRCSSHLGLVWFRPVLPSTPPPAGTALAGLPVAEDRAPPTWEPVKGSSVSASLCESCAMLDVAGGGPVVLLNPKGVRASRTSVQALADCGGS